MCGLLTYILTGLCPLLLPACLQDCVKRMLVRDPSKRATAAEVLAHDWIKENGVAGDNEIEPEVLKRIRSFAGELLQGPGSVAVQ
jgi:serine/threonine protein kinase